ncbi:hypothetical protein SALBM311S_08203 [Streptomyces alboniger]
MPGLTRRHSRWTERLRSTLAAVGLAPAGRAGARMARAFGVSVSRSAVLRLLDALPEPEVPAPRVVGVDEYATRKGRVYGTVLVDVETRRPVDLLPDRDASSLVPARSAPDPSPNTEPPAQEGPAGAVGPLKCAWTSQAPYGEALTPLQLLDGLLPQRLIRGLYAERRCAHHLLPGDAAGTCQPPTVAILNRGHGWASYGSWSRRPRPSTGCTSGTWTPGGRSSCRPPRAPATPGPGSRSWTRSPARAATRTASRARRCSSWTACSVITRSTACTSALGGCI